MSESIEIPVPVTLPSWRLSKRGNLWLDTGDLLATVLLRRDGYWQGRVLRKGPEGSPFVGERRLTVNRLPNLTRYRRPILTLSSDEFWR
jgi:hypothetical protein